MLKSILPALALIVAAPTAALADQVIHVPPFRTVEVHGGGHATLRHGDRQRVVLIKGDPSIADIRVTGDGTLVLSPCKDWCWGNQKFEVEVTTPAIAGVSVHGGGEMDVDGRFPRQPSLKVSVHGGGDADLRNLPADNVAAEVHGGGDAEVRAERTLTAEVHGGGDLHFWGHPRVSSSTSGGGDIESGE
ncbi:MAG TPA: DUF2807 domain-containing protein [Rhizomicrobium sp.]|jgi:hypothetical protein